jgi:hypothetical protein
MALTLVERTNITKLVVSMFNAAPGATYLAELSVAFEANGRSLSSLAKDLSLTGAYKLIAPAFQTASDFATSFLTPLGLQTNTEAVAYITAKFNAGVNKGQISLDAAAALAVYTGADASLLAAKAILGNKTVVALYYSVDKQVAVTDLAVLKTVVAGVTADVATIVTAKAVVDNVAVAGSTFTLTTAIDTFTGAAGNDTYTGVVGTGATLNVGDTLSAGAGTDTLRVAFGSNVALAASVAGVSLNGFEVLSLINPGDSAIDASTLTGLTTLRVEDATLLAAKTITSSLGLVNVSLATAAGAPTAGAVTWAANAADTTLNLTLNGYQGSPAAAAALTVTGAAATTLNIASTTAANKVAAFTGPATVTTLNITAATALTNTSTKAVAATKVNVEGAGAVALGTTDFAAIVTVDASKATGAVSMTAEANSTLTYKGGSGADTLVFATAGDLTSVDVIDLGAGSNTLSIADTALGGTATAAFNTVVNAITSAQTILVTGAATVDMSGVTARILSLGATSNFNVTKIDALDKLVVNGVTAGTVTAIAPLGFNTFNMELNGTAAAVAATGTLDVTQQATVNILSTGAATTAGANAIGAVTNTTNATFNLTGANALTITSLSAAAAVDASKMTGALTITGANAASSFTGGSAIDTITGATVAGGDIFIGGAGNDIINTAAVTGTVATVITGGLGADAINLLAVGADVGKLVTLNATAAQSFATAAQFDTVTFADQALNGTNIVTLVTGLLGSTLTGATAVVLGTTTVTAGGFLAVGSVSATLTTTNQTFQIYQDSNSNGIIDASDLRVDFTDGVAADTMAITLVGSQIVVTSTGV